VIFEVSGGVHDLSWLAEHPHLRAGHGASGGGNRRDGARGKDLVVHVPDGTVVFDDEGLLADLVGEGSRAVVAGGGRGGRGNVHFASPKNRVPRTAEPGEPGEQRRLRVELRIVADVGLVGLPNAGKSTLLARLSAARPKVAEYPFTTLTPNLGVSGEGEDRFVVADVPGLIEGAHEGKGLGHRFLRHVLRCRALVMVVDLAAPDPSADLATLRSELEAFDPELVARPSVVVGTKADLVADPFAAAEGLGADVLVVSGKTGDGIGELADRLGILAREAAAEEPERLSHVVLRPGRPRFTIVRDPDGAWRVAGRGVERAVLEADLDDEDQIDRLQTRLRRMGVFRRLAADGARRGDEVRIASQVFEYVPDEET
jgi:GTP-binding protein